GQPLFRLPGRQGQPWPYLAYAAGAYLGRATELLLKQAGTAIHLERVYETDMAEGLKAMALEGHGVAFLPASAVRKDVEAGRLVHAAPELQGLDLALDLRAYRQKPGGREPARRAAEALWDFLAARTGTIGK